jgi:hypothetical protein
MKVSIPKRDKNKTTSQRHLKLNRPWRLHEAACGNFWAWKCFQYIYYEVQAISKSSLNPYTGFP